ncbi:hypothetical protein [Thiocapsa sp. UBA6158]|jgi:hypothetical protein|nr:hypothetical protein [Thiocapsa sp. UBA6158]
MIDATAILMTICLAWPVVLSGAWDHKPEPGEHPQATFDDLYPTTEGSPT